MPYTNIDKPIKYFGTSAYVGQNGSRNVTDTTNIQFTPDFVWIKHRQDVANHALFDVVRGVGKWLESNTTTAEQTQSQSITAFVDGGFTVGTEPNTPRTDESGGTPNHVAWEWKANGAGVSNTSGTITSTVSANTTSGFSIVSYTGNATNGATVGHGLGVAPKIIIIKNRSSAEHWRFHTTAIDGSYDLLYLNLTNAKSDSSITAPTSSVFSLDAFTEDNGSGNNIIAYCFAEVKGYSKAFSYTGNGSTDGTFIYTGFKPAMVIFKRTDSAGFNWVIHDNKRDTDNPDSAYLHPNTTGSESTDRDIDLLSNGFKMRNSNTTWNASGGTYIGFAVAESPFVSSKGIPCTAR